MRVPAKWRPFFYVTAAVALSALAVSGRADEIRLKDGRKLNGVIVAYEDGMFKVKTDYGYELVEKDKITAIIPTTPAKSAPDSAKKDPQHPSKPANDAQFQTEPAVATASNASSNASPTNASVKTVTPSPNARSEKTPSSSASSSAKTAVPANASTANAPAPANNTSTAATTPAPSAPAPPKEPEVPVNREEVTGNLYTNYTHAFRMYKAPSWNLIEEARSALPNAIVAMGTSNESTLLVVGEEKTKDSLDLTAAAIEKRLHDVYANYQRVSQRKETVGGLPAIEYQYRGKAEDHDWSGRLVVIARGKDGRDILTVLAMTYADSDLIQIQENVIARSIASLDFNVH